jgi:hypothetical protein
LTPKKSAIALSVLSLYLVPPPGGFKYAIEFLMIRSPGVEPALAPQVGGVHVALDDRAVERDVALDPLELAELGVLQEASLDRAAQLDLEVERLPIRPFRDALIEECVGIGRSWRGERGGRSRASGR